MRNNLDTLEKNAKEMSTKPFFKWAGGKSQLLGRFENFFPIELKSGEIQNYYEPFLGGGAVFFHIIQKYPIQNCYLSDINEELILVYNVVKRNVSSLISVLKELKTDYLKLNDVNREKFYYYVRQELNASKGTFDYSSYSESWIKRSAQLLFLNKTCFNGLFRQNSKGEFNVPFGRYKNPSILNEENLVNVSRLLKKAKIEKMDFKKLPQIVKENSFIYFDPPYRPINKTSSFTAYSKFDFNDTEQIELSRIFSTVSKIKNVKIMLSNSDPKNDNPSDDFFEVRYNNYYISRIKALRMINCKGDRRGAINELIITNYLQNYEC